MSFLFKLFRYFFVAILTIQTVSLHAARTSPTLVEEEIFTFDDLAVTQKMLFEVMIVNDLNLKFSGVNDMRNLILFELVLLHKITNLSCYLKDKALQKDLNAILTVIDHLFFSYGHEVSVNILKTALDEAKLSISDIRDKDNFIMLHYPRDIKDQDWKHRCKIILCAAGDKALRLISEHHPLHQSPGQCWPCYTPWHFALWNGNKNMIDIFMAYAVDDESKEMLLCAKNHHEQTTALHIAADANLPVIFEMLLKLASTIPGLVAKLLVMQTRTGKTIEDLAHDKPEILDILNLYH